MSMENSMDDFEAKRPDAITALGILGFINTGIFIIVFLFAALGFKQVKEMPQEQWEETIEESLAQVKSMVPPEELAVYKEELFPVLKEQGFTMVLILLALTVVRFIAIIRMWKQQKSGLPMYASSQLFRILVPVFFLGAAGFTLFGAVLAIGMALGWFTQRKYLR